MSTHTYYIILAGILIAALPIVPKMVAFRTRVLYALHLNRFASWNERNACVLVVVVRIMFAAIAVLLLVMGLRAN